MTVPKGEIIADGLSLPHSLLLEDRYLYFLESGKGTLNRINRDTNEMEVVHKFERFVRGMKKLDNLFFIGYSAVRKTSKTFSSVRFDNPTENAGILIYDLELNEVISQLEYDQDVEEIYDLNYFDGFLKPAIVNDKQEEFNNVITFPNKVFWKKAKEDEK